MLIHTTIGVYPAWRQLKHMGWKINGVPAANLEAHISYNKDWRPGRALFVDGECVYDGMNSPEEIEAMKEMVKEVMIKHKMTKDTQPYQ